MTNLLNPTESLESYFDELFAMDDEESSDTSGIQEQSPTTGSKPSLPAININANANTNTGTPASANLKAQTLSKPVEALSAFAEPSDTQREKLQKLLQSAPPKVQVDTKVSTAAEASIKTDIQIDVKPKPIEVQPVAVKVAAPAALKPNTVEPIAEVQTEEQMHLAMDAKLAEWLPNGRPHWGQSRFDVLLFQVSGLTLAVPLASLGQIQKITEELTPLFGQADWFMGLLPTPAGKIRTVNTAKFVMPERYDENFLKTAKLVVSINGVPWGLAVDSVNQPISIDPDQVKWRGDRTKRPWLAGTVKEHMCALLDIPTIGLMLQSADKNAYKTYG